MDIHQLVELLFSNIWTDIKCAISHPVKWPKEQVQVDFTPKDKCPCSLGLSSTAIVVEQDGFITARTNLKPHWVNN